MSQETVDSNATVQQMTCFQVFSIFGWFAAVEYVSFPRFLRMAFYYQGKSDPSYVVVKHSI